MIDVSIGEERAARLAQFKAATINDLHSLTVARFAHVFTLNTKSTSKSAVQHERGPRKPKPARPLVGMNNMPTDARGSGGAFARGQSSRPHGQLTQRQLIYRQRHAFHAGTSAGVMAGGGGVDPNDQAMSLVHANTYIKKPIKDLFSNPFMRPQNLLYHNHREEFPSAASRNQSSALNSTMDLAACPALVEAFGGSSSPMKVTGANRGLCNSYDTIKQRKFEPPFGVLDQMSSYVQSHLGSATTTPLTIAPTTSLHPLLPSASTAPIRQLCSSYRDTTPTSGEPIQTLDAAAAAVADLSGVYEENQAHDIVQNSDDSTCSEEIVVDDVVSDRQATANTWNSTPTEAARDGYGARSGCSSLSIRRLTMLDTNESVNQRSSNQSSVSSLDRDLFGQGRFRQVHDRSADPAMFIDMANENRPGAQKTATSDAAPSGHTQVDYLSQVVAGYQLPNAGHLGPMRLRQGDPSLQQAMHQAQGPHLSACSDQELKAVDQMMIYNSIFASVLSHFANAGPTTRQRFVQHDGGNGHASVGLQRRGQPGADSLAQCAASRGHAEVNP